jgi:hypothetical protein
VQCRRVWSCLPAKGHKPKSVCVTEPGPCGPSSQWDSARGTDPHSPSPCPPRCLPLVCPSLCPSVCLVRLSVRSLIRHAPKKGTKAQSRAEQSRAEFGRETGGAATKPSQPVTRAADREQRERERERGGEGEEVDCSCVSAPSSHCVLCRRWRRVGAGATTVHVTG